MAKKAVNLTETEFDTLVLELIDLSGSMVFSKIEGISHKDLESCLGNGNILCNTCELVDSIDRLKRTDRIDLRLACKVVKGVSIVFTEILAEGFFTSKSKN